jgi:hypothetical protein
MPSTSFNLRNREYKRVEIVIREWGENQVDQGDQVDPYQQLFGVPVGSSWHISIPQAPLEEDSEVLLEEICDMESGGSSRF